MFIFVLDLIRLRRLEYYNVKDSKAYEIQIRDFTVYMPSIPLAPKYYNNNPQILEAYIIKYMESVALEKFLDQDPELSRQTIE